MLYVIKGALVRLYSGMGITGIIADIPEIVCSVTVRDGMTTNLE